MPFHLLSEPETRKSPWRAFNGFFTVAVTKRTIEASINSISCPSEPSVISSKCRYRQSNPKESILIQHEIRDSGRVTHTKVTEYRLPLTRANTITWANTITRANTISRANTHTF